jgi:glucose-6-phosphate isomerase
MNKFNLKNTPQWQNLKKHYLNMKKVHLKKLFMDKNRFNTFSIREDNLGITFDYSKNIINSDTFNLLLEFVKIAKVNKYTRKMFAGEKINWTEKRAVLHTALRNRSNIPIYINGKNIMIEINKVLDKMRKFSNDLINGKLVGITGKKITDIVNIGIGGSNLGPEMVCEALKYYAIGPNIHFVSNIDSSNIYEILKKLTPETTLFIIASKTFTTLETITNFLTAKKWLTTKLSYDKAVKKHFVALSANIKKVIEFGIDEKNIFTLWDFINGRYSLWSAIGLSIVCYLGFDKFIELLEGANYVDNHFLNTPYKKNIPIVMAVLGFWYNNFFAASSHAILPYSQYLHKFPAYLQQEDMESNGKTINFEGNKINYETGPIIWGESGTNGQHSFYQFIYQGTKFIPCDFIGFINPPKRIGDHHEKLMANYFAHGKALAFGLTKDEIIENLEKTNVSLKDKKILMPHKVLKGNIPINNILIDELTPRTLGALIALYEHKTFTQGIIWRINSFDQWGIEIGKTLADIILKELKGKDRNKYDDSTTNLIKIFNSHKNISRKK